MSHATQAKSRFGGLHRQPRIAAPAALVLAIAAAALSAGCANPSRSRDLANPQVSGVTLAQQVCSNCHGVTGNSVSPNFPRLAAQQPAYLTSQLQGFKGHSRSDPAGFEYMWGLSRSLTEGQIADLAAYYAAQTAAPHPFEGDAARLAAGQAVFESGVPDQGVPACSSCHGPKAEGMATFPRLAGQHEDYLVKQLGVFQRTDERPEGAIMKTVAHAMTPENMSDVATYLQSLRP